MRTCVVGAGGQLGYELCKKIGPSAVGLTRADLDITDKNSVIMKFAEIRPDLVINAAAYTNVDGAESDPDACNRVNVEGTKNLVDAAKAMDCSFMQISSDYVFSGDFGRKKPFLETDEPSPQGVYAQSKLASEHVALSYAKSFVVRTCGLYANNDGEKEFNNFPNTILRLAATRPELSIVGDQRCTPSYVPHVADAIIALSMTDGYGVYHITNAGSATWYEFATYLVRLEGVGTSLCEITTREFGAVAPRPAFSVLDTLRFESTGLPALPSWKQALEEYTNKRSNAPDGKRLKTFR